MSKRPSLGNCSGRAAKRPAQQRQQKHLYLVVDDWEKGYSIHKVGEDDFDSDADAGVDDLRPAKSPVVRIEAHHPYPWALAAHGSKILAMYPSDSSPGIPVFDTETLGVTVYPYPRSRYAIRAYKPVYASVGDRLVAFVFPHLEVLGPEPPPLPPIETEMPWSWTSVEPVAPFASCLVSSYALHPDGRTIFMSVKGWQPNPDQTLSFRGQRNSTFTLDTESLEWTYLGEWLLPFKDRAYYDRELDAWVGLCLYKEGVGHVCSCDVPPAAGCETMPAWKLGNDLFFDMNSETHVGATLVYMGDSRFCLVECRHHKDYNLYPSLRVLAMDSFVLKYSKEGDLRTAHHRAYASMSYHQSAYEFGQPISNPVAFWM
ncbi:uncharacterized protein LOC133904034 [Phragmites australis]|uniref:uncharacterized protein LOC133904034 n=1 Tax=Phragmites australis TaxID=29695 RepID=UPI002D7A0734|nr:uncharacterized protein LOC133904034 [Phragmites australis]